jgi:Ni,Fe-hydrogenase III small subunit
MAMKKGSRTGSYLRYSLSKNLSCYTFLDQNLKRYWDQFIYLMRPSELSYCKESLQPENANMMIIGGYVNRKQLPYIMKAYEELHRPKIVMVLGVSAMNGGILKSYNSIENLRDYIPIDYYVQGDPPHSDLIRVAMELLVNKIRSGEIVDDERIS